MPEKYAPWPFIIFVSCLVLVITLLNQTESLIRSVTAFWFLFVVPGMSLVKLLDIKNPVYEWTLSIALSMALGTVIAGLFVYSDRWDPNWVLAVLIIISLIGATSQVFSGKTSPIPNDNHD